MKATIQYSEKKYGTGSNADRYTLEIDPDVRTIYRDTETPEGEEGYEECALNELVFKFKFDSAADGISDNWDSMAVVKEVRLSLDYSAAQQLAKAINYMVFKHELTGSTEGVKMEINEGDLADSSGNEPVQREVELADALSNILLGERVPLDITNKSTGEVLIPAGRIISKACIHKLVANVRVIEIGPSPIRIKIMGIIDGHL